MGDDEVLPPEIEAIVEESRRHPERDQPRPRRPVRANAGAQD